VRLHDLLKQLEQVAPVTLSDAYCKTYDAYDNSGILLNSGKAVNGVVFSLDFSRGAIEEAVQNGYTAIVTHHPAIFGGIKHIDATDNGLGEKLTLCMQNGISVISMHLNFDCAEKGIDHYLMQGLGGSAGRIMDKISTGGYGRLFEITPITFEQFAKNAQETFHSQKLRFYGEGQREIKRVASFCGAGSDDRTIAYAMANHAEVFVSADMKHHHIAALCEAGLCVVDMTHYASENYGFMKIVEPIAKALGVPYLLYTDQNLL
jgi:dinuclear metal center YbgI/SA1388 family protein